MRRVKLFLCCQHSLSGWKKFKWSWEKFPAAIVPDPDSQVCCCCYNGEKSTAKDIYFQYRNIFLHEDLAGHFGNQYILLKMDSRLSWSGKIQFNPFVLINCSSGHHSCVLNSSHILSGIHYTGRVHIQGEDPGWARIIISICNQSSSGRSGQGSALIRASLEIRDTVWWSHTQTFHRRR